MPLARLRQLLIIMLAFLGGALIALLVLPGPASKPSATSGKAEVGGPFTLTDHTGKRVTGKDFRGRIQIVYFGFTLCPDICPAGLQVMAAALDELGPLADKIAPIFVTLDPGHDAPALLADYVRSFSPRLIGLTGTEAEIRDLAKAYHVYYRREPDPNSTTGYTIDHTALFYVMGRDGQYVTHLQHSTSTDDMVARLKQLF